MSQTLTNEYRDNLIRMLGTKGYPAAFDPQYRATWDLSSLPEAKGPWSRLVQVLLFADAMAQHKIQLWAGRWPMKSPHKFDPRALYANLQIEDFKSAYKYFMDELRRTRCFDTFELKSTRVDVSVLRDHYTVTYNVCLTPRRNALFDQARAKLQGLLFYGSPPVPLRDNKKNGRSTLPKLGASVADPSNALRYAITVMPSDGYSSFASRTQGDVLVMRMTLTREIDPLPWLSRAKLQTFLKTSFNKAMR